MKHILGLDLGTNSIGWAVINATTDENTHKEQLIGINAAGSRIIPMDAAQLGDFNKGNTVSQTANRTQYRSTRRLHERKNFAGKDYTAYYNYWASFHPITLLN